MSKALWIYTDKWNVPPSWVWEVKKKAEIDVDIKAYHEDFSPESFEGIFILADGFFWDRERILQFALERKVNPLKVKVFPWKEIQQIFPATAFQIFERFFLDVIKRREFPPTRAVQLLPERKVLLVPRGEGMLEEALSQLGIQPLVIDEPFWVKRERVNFLLYGSSFTKVVGAIVLFPEWRERPPLFIPAEVEETGRAVSLTHFKDAVSQKTMRGRTVIFIVSPENCSLEDWKEVFLLSRELVEREQAQVLVLTQEVMVAGASLEEEYRDARCEGVLFEKTRIDTVQLQSTMDMRGVWIEFESEKDHYRLRFRADWIVYVPQRECLPFVATPWWKGERQEEAFIDLENPNLLPFSSFLEGVFVFSRRGQDGFLQLAQVVGEYMNRGRVALSECASVDEEKCVLCLTCFRSCPWGAIGIERENKRKKARINWERCHLCGICVAFCPASAIGINSLYLEDFFFIKTTRSEE